MEEQLQNHYLHFNLTSIIIQMIDLIKLLKLNNIFSKKKNHLT